MGMFVKDFVIDIELKQIIIYLIFLYHEELLLLLSEHYDAVRL